ncbi:MAG: hypothetical protein H8E85_03690 [Candidatus Marinimicrobia bacterium]|nr:hypothetical protein [Candidatus Neomarinimicrobiota bacterium]
MKTGKDIIIAVILLCTSIIVAAEYTPEQKQELGNQAVHEMMQKIFSESMKAKRAFLENQHREIPLSNFATTAPRSEFIVNADISDELAAGTESSTVYASTDGQSTWQSAPATPMGSTGYETTWSGTINTNDGNSAHSYLSGLINSEALGENFGTIIVSGTPHNENGNWPPGSNLYAHMVDEPTGDAPSNQDITALRGTYKGNNATDGEGNEYIDVERFYMNLSLNGGCCDEGGLFGPWYLYGVGIVNPEAEEEVAYAIGYGDGGFGELVPGLYKITGDLATGDIGGFDLLTSNISYSTSGNDMQATALMSYITNDSQWGTWPNSFNGFIVLGVTIEASLDGLDVAAEVKDQTNPGLMICNTTSQEGNIALSLSSPVYDADTGSLSVTYSDGDGNLPWKKSLELCEPGTDNCMYSFDMIPDGHSYKGGVTFSVSTEGVSDGDYDARLWFADDDLDTYPSAQIVLPITVGSGGGGCAIVGDLNDDSLTNVIDVVLLVNLILSSAEVDTCSDVNGDGILNVIDIVLLVNIVLGG